MPRGCDWTEARSNGMDPSCDKMKRPLDGAPAYVCQLRNVIMVQSCALDSDCDELNFCHKRVCVEIGMDDPCRLPRLSATLNLAQQLGTGAPAPSSNGTAALPGRKRLLTPLQLEMLRKEIFKSPLCPSELICSKALHRCVRPVPTFKVIPPIVSPYPLGGTRAANGTAAPQVPLTAYSMLADDGDGKRGVICRRSTDCRVDFGCDKGRCVPLPRLNEKCMGGKDGAAQCRRPFVCSASGVCRFPCFGDLDCAQEGVSVGVTGAGDHGEHFVCLKDGGYCDVEATSVNVLLIGAIVIPVVVALVVALVVIVIFKKKNKKLHAYVEKVHFADRRAAAPRERDRRRRASEPRHRDDDSDDQPHRGHSGSRRACDDVPRDFPAALACGHEPREKLLHPKKRDLECDSYTSTKRKASQHVSRDTSRDAGHRSQGSAKRPPPPSSPVEEDAYRTGNDAKADELAREGRAKHHHPPNKRRPDRSASSIRVPQNKQDAHGPDNKHEAPQTQRPTSPRPERLHQYLHACHSQSSVDR